jgi:signal transduction histidine kinase
MATTDPNQPARAIPCNFLDQDFHVLAMLSCDFYWEQDNAMRFTRLVSGREPDTAPSRARGLLGKTRWELHKAMPLDMSWDEHRLQLARRQAFRDFRYTVVTGLGHRYYFSTSGTPAFNADGSFAGYRGTTRDITAQCESERLRRDAEALVQMAAAAGRLGAWAVDIGSRRLTWSREVCAIHEVPEGFRCSIEEALAFYAPDCQNTVMNAFIACVTRGQSFDIEAQIITATQRRVWVRVIGEPERDISGAVSVVQGAFQDVTRSRQLAEAALRAQEEIQQLNAQLEERVQLRTEQLQRATRELEAFSYSVAHDLRSPLSAVNGFCQLLAKVELGRISEKGRHYLERIRLATNQMDSITGGLLALAQVGRTALRREPLDLAAISRELLDSLQEHDPQRRVEVHVMPGVQAHGDAVLVTQVLCNLLSNAWKFTARRRHARIEVGVELHPGKPAVYRVSDNGAGFDMACATALFEPFHRLHADAEFEGTGVGLATVQRIVQRHGGHIWAQAAPGQGATFYFTLGDG